MLQMFRIEAKNLETGVLGTRIIIFVCGTCSEPSTMFSLNFTGNDQRCLKEVTLGKRVGFYRIRGDLGSGNFSQVKIAVNSLTRGEFGFI